MFRDLIHRYIVLVFEVIMISGVVSIVLYTCDMFFSVKFSKINTHSPMHHFRLPPPKSTIQPFITVRERSCGKIMFLHLSVILFTGVHPPRQTPLRHTFPWADTSQADNHPRLAPPYRHLPSDGRYVSYWNVFLLLSKN